MKTMKFLAVLVMLSLSMGVSAQNAMQKKVMQTKSALKEKASKDAKNEAKRMAKEGWTVSPGGLPLEKQIDRWYAIKEDFDDDGEPAYVTGEGRAQGENFHAAQVQATELARMELASSISSEATGIVDNMIANKMLGDDQAASITTTLMESKSIFSQKIGRVQTPLIATRVLKNNNKEVIVRMATKASSIKEIAKQAVRAELEKQGKELSEELKAYFDKD